MRRLGFTLLVTASMAVAATPDVWAETPLSFEAGPDETWRIAAEGGLGGLVHLTVESGIAITSLISFVTLCMFGCEEEDISGTQVALVTTYWLLPPLASSAVIYAIGSGSDWYEPSFLHALLAGVVTQGIALGTSWVAHELSNTSSGRETAVTLAIILPPLLTVAAEVAAMNLTKERRVRTVVDASGPALLPPTPVVISAVDGPAMGIVIPVRW
ncbi:MAG: hypothetical protein HY791_38200 [Deltaproteobacteria bacterium]|nr:hypothetical protein [Deltaproteobacteria bacterium]